MLMELANEAVAAAQQSGVDLTITCRIRKVGSPNDTGRAGQVSVSMRRLNRRPVNYETEQ
jgi:hypothetical protein